MNQKQSMRRKAVRTANLPAKTHARYAKESVQKRKTLQKKYDSLGKFAS